LRKIPVVVKAVSDEKLLELSLIENIQRQELNPIEEAKAYKNLVEKLGLTQEIIAERVGKNRTVITTALRLLKLPKDIQELVEEEKISAGHGRALLMIGEVETQRQLTRNIIEMSLSVRETEKAIKRLNRNHSATVENKVFKPKKSNQKNQQRGGANTCKQNSYVESRCKYKSGRNKIEKIFWNKCTDNS